MTWGEKETIYGEWGERGRGKKVKEKVKKKNREKESYMQRETEELHRVRVSVVERLVKLDKQDTGMRRKVPCE